MLFSSLAIGAVLLSSAAAADIFIEAVLSNSTKHDATYRVQSKDQARVQAMGTVLNGTLGMVDCNPEPENPTLIRCTSKADFEWPPYSKATCRKGKLSDCVMRYVQSKVAPDSFLSAVLRYKNGALTATRTPIHSEAFPLIAQEIKKKYNIVCTAQGKTLHCGNHVPPFERIRVSCSYGPKFTATDLKGCVVFE